MEKVLEQSDNNKAREDTFDLFIKSGGKATEVVSGLKFHSQNDVKLFLECQEIIKNKGKMK